MRRLLGTLAVLCGLSAVLQPAEAGRGTPLKLGGVSKPQLYLPIVLWHGMGDSCCSEYSVGAVADAIRSALPGVFVFSIATGSTEFADVLTSYFGDVNEQVASVCDQLMGLPQLRDGYVGVGFSQGGQFLRAVAQRCQHMGPPMHTLVTLGAQHQGVMDLPGCWQPGTATNSTPGLVCRVMQKLLARGAYNSFAQSHVVQAQYFKDPDALDTYLRSSRFLADVNNEVAARRRATYRDNLASLRRLVLFQFDGDEMVVPKESAHFGFFNGSRLLPLREQPLYAEDWLGLRALDEAGRLLLLHAPGPHMQFSLDWFRREVLLPYLAVPAQAAADDAAGGGPVAAGAAAAAAAMSRKS